MKGFSVQVCLSGKVLWERDERGGIASSGYIADGTQAKIVKMLQDATEQAIAELGAFEVTDRVADVGTSTA